MSRSRSFFSKPFVSGLSGGLVVLVFGWIAIAAGWVEADDSTGKSGVQTSVAEKPPLSEPVSAGDALTAGEIFEKTGPAVAFIEAEQSGAATESPFGPVPGGGGTATGSGFLIDNGGTILTNAHVVEGSNAISVQLGEDGERLDAKLLGADVSTDVAVLRVDPDKVQAAPLEIADSTKVKVGDAVVAIGNPFGLDRTVTTGIVSGLQREISAPNNFTISDVIQTDAAINPGNSGGPLLDAQGRVIGINSQIATAGGQGNVGVGFAVPTSTVQTVSDQILEDGDADHAFIGISGGDLTPQIAGVLNLDIEEGALIQDVTPDGPADKSGLRAGDATMSTDGGEVRVGGDVIVAIDGEPVEGMDDVIAMVNTKEPGDEIELDVHRDGETKSITLELGDRPDQATG
jgi:S1-C subfamily serine protease